MRKLKLVTVLSILALAVGLVGFVPGNAPPAQAAPPATSIVYNLYATDGYVEMADGTAVYNYGFIGGRAGVPFTYQTSCVPGAMDPLTGIRPCTGSTNMTVAGGAPAPTGGPVNIGTGEDLLQGNAQFPAPIVYAAVGDVVEMRLKNLGVKANPTAPNDPHSIHLHGLDVDAANDGVPETSVGAVPANLCFDGTTAADCTAVGGPAPGAGNVVVYMFTPKAEGTYMYHCHQEADIHVNMGMYGALVVYSRGDRGNPKTAYNNGGPGQGFGGTEFGFQYDKDYIMLLSEVDVRGHADEEGTYGLATDVPAPLVPAQTWDPFPYNWAQYKPQYWFINGLSFPNTVHANFPSGYTFADWLTAHPGYDPLITGSVSTPNGYWGTKGQKVLIRVINMGFETQPMHMHGYHGKILGSDQRVWDWANQPLAGKTPPTAFGLGLEKQTLTIGSGETYEWLVDFGQQSFQSTYPVGTQSRYDPTTNLPVPNTSDPLQFPAIPDAGDPAGPPYIGGPTVTGVVDILTGGPPLFTATQFFPFHNHDDYKATNNGVYPGGMFTMLVPTP
jgi:FtsP/CotA-like multicopper oxidase with cupredoxin domain